MGRFTLLLAVVTGLFSVSETKAQVPYVLGIDSIAALPDSVIDGQEYVFYVEMTNASPLVFQGDSNSVTLMFEYNGTDTVEADETILQSQFVGPIGNSTLLQVRHTFNTGGGNTLGIGINVVVVWPRINDGIDPLQEVAEPPYVRNVVLVEPNSIHGPRSNQRFRAFPNPSNGIFELASDPTEAIESVNLFDLSGRHLQSWDAQQLRLYEVESGLSGNFLLEVVYEDGEKGHQIIVLN